ncbi:MAG: hypothetical protein U0166_25185 [Acidobacteriota bacterium]
MTHANEIATTLIDTYLTSHALARFELRHHGYPLVKDPSWLVGELVPHYLARIPRKDPWGAPYVYSAHKVLVRKDPKVKSQLTDSYEFSAGIREATTGHLLPLRIFNGTFVEAPTTHLMPLLKLREYARYPGSAADVRHALKMFALARPLELVKFIVLRTVEDLADRQCAHELAAFQKFNEPARLRTFAKEILDRFGAKK